MGTLVESSGLRYVEMHHAAQMRALPRETHAIRRVLVCVDSSPFSEACLRQGVAISRNLGSAITLLHVMQPPNEGPGLHPPDVLDWEMSRLEASAHLDRLSQEGARASGRKVETRLEQGHPAERIIAVARELGADLMVLGSQGERGAAGWNLGSTVQQVLALARSSVLIARATATDATPPQRILVPLDGSLRAESVLPTVVRIAAASGAEMLLVFVAQELVATAVLRAQEDLELAQELARRLEASGRRYLEELRERLVHEGARVRTLVVRSANERQSILDLSNAERSDLVVLSAHGAVCNPASTFGSVTSQLINDSVVPLLVLQDLRDTELRGRDGDRSAPPLRACYPEGL